MEKTVLAIGELLWDILPDETVLGGAAFNFVYRLGSLGDAGFVVSRLGKDDLGKEAFDKVASLGVDTTLIQYDEKYPTGTVKVSFDEDNNPDYVIIPGVAYDYMELTDQLAEAATKADCLWFSTLTQRSEKSRETIEQLLQLCKPIVRLYDINLRKKCYNKEVIVSSLKQADVLKLNQDEAAELGEMLGVSHNTVADFCQAVSEKYGLKYCLVTLDDKGAFAFSSDNGEKIYIPGFKVELVDSLGAGDAFTAGFIHKLLRGSSLTEACETGNILGAIVCMQKGATGEISAEDIEEFKFGKYKRNVHPNLKEYVN